MSFGRGIAEGVAGLLVGVIALAFLLGALVALGLPLLWHWLKPIIHGLTS